MDKRYIFPISILVVIVMWLFYATLIRRITELEKENLFLEKQIKLLEKEKVDKKLEIERLTDFSKIEKEMKEKRGMIVSDKINFFRIEEKSDSLGE